MTLLWNFIFSNNIHVTTCNFIGHDGIPKLSPLVYQHDNQRLYTDLIKCHLSIDLGDRTTEMSTITADEENILRYAAGYVPFKLLKYEKSPSGCIIECLSQAVDGEESSLLEYTTKWTTLVNRGWLFEINDTAYMLFREIELKVRKHLFIAFERSTSMSDYDKRKTIVHVLFLSEFWT